MSKYSIIYHIQRNDLEATDLQISGLRYKILLTVTVLYNTNFVSFCRMERILILQNSV